MTYTIQLVGARAGIGTTTATVLLAEHCKAHLRICETDIHDLAYDMNTPRRFIDTDIEFSDLPAVDGSAPDERWLVVNNTYPCLAHARRRLDVDGFDRHVLIYNRQLALSPRDIALALDMGEHAAMIVWDNSVARMVDAGLLGARPVQSHIVNDDCHSLQRLRNAYYHIEGAA